MEHIQLLKSLPIFDGLTTLELVQINKLIHVQKYSESETIIHEGDEPTHIFVIKSGSVRVFLEQAPSDTLSTLSAGDHFGEMAFIDNSPRSASIVAESDCEMLLLPIGDFRALLGKDSQILVRVQDAMLRELCRRLRSSNQHHLRGTTSDNPEKLEI